MPRGEYGRPRAHHAGLPASRAFVGFAGITIPTVHIPSPAEIKQQLEHTAAQADQVEHTVKVRGAILAVGAIAALGFIMALSALADPS